MANRISHSLLDPWIVPVVKRVYPALPIPRRFPPEGLILFGHVSAILGAVGFAMSLTTWWGGWLAALGVAGNHFFDSIDGTHARATNQCRNGGELLDHFTDPLSFAYWLIGWSVAIQQLEFGIAGVVILFATAVLTNIKAKITGEFTLASFGPTEFKALLVLMGTTAAIVSQFGIGNLAILEGLRSGAWISYAAMIVVGIVQLVAGLIQAVRDVNQVTTGVDTSEWNVTRSS